VTRWEFSKFL